MGAGGCRRRRREVRTSRPLAALSQLAPRLCRAFKKTMSMTPVPLSNSKPCANVSVGARHILTSSIATRSRLTLRRKAACTRGSWAARINDGSGVKPYMQLNLTPRNNRSGSSRSVTTGSMGGRNRPARRSSNPLPVKSSTWHVIML